MLKFKQTQLIYQLKTKVDNLPTQPSDYDNVKKEASDANVLSKSNKQTIDNIVSFDESKYFSQNSQNLTANKVGNDNEVANIGKSFKGKIFIGDSSNSISIGTNTQKI